MLPARQRLGDLAMPLEQNGQENHVRLERFPQRPGNDRGPDRLRLRITLHGSFNARPWVTNLRAVVL